MSIFNTINYQVPEDKATFLYNGDCYVILYTGEDGKNIVYFWQGNKCSIDEKGASAIHAARIDNEDLGGKAMQVKIDCKISNLDEIFQPLDIQQIEYYLF